MSITPRRRWDEMTTEDFAALDPARCVALLPVGAIEQHGPHLPLSVDACLADGIVAGALAQLPAELPVTLLPTLPVGKSDEHRDFPGTLTLSAETLTRVWVEIGCSVHRAGLRKLVIFNAHGGNPPVMEIAARELRQRCASAAACWSCRSTGGAPACRRGSSTRWSWRTASTAARSRPR